MLSNYWCGARIVDRKLVLDEPNAFRVAMWRLKEGRVVVKIEQPASKRTVDQNAYLHAVPFPILAEHFGDSVEGVKLDLMGEKWGWKPSPLDPARLVPVKPNTSSMTIEECTQFIDWLIPWAAMNHGVLIPLPNEYAA
jgi:hypothetical protein